MSKHQLFYSILFTVLIVLVTSTITNAQVVPPPPPASPAGAPLDPISWVLLGAGGAVAGKKYYDKRKQKNTDNENL